MSAHTHRDDLSVLGDDRDDRTVRVVAIAVAVLVHLVALLIYVDGRDDDAFALPAATAPQLQSFRPAPPPPPPRPERPERERKELAPIPEIELDFDVPETESEPLAPPPVELPMMLFTGETSPPARAVGAPAPGTSEPLLPGAQGLTLPQLIRSTEVKPSYPDKARDSRVNGQVVLICVVTRRGDVEDCRIIHESPQGLGFSASASAAVVQWKYVPGKREGLAVDVYMTITVTFTLGF